MFFDRETDIDALIAAHRTALDARLSPRAAELADRTVKLYHKQKADPDASEIQHEMDEVAKERNRVIQQQADILRQLRMNYYRVSVDLLDVEMLEDDDRALLYDVRQKLGAEIYSNYERRVYHMAESAILKRQEEEAQYPILIALRVLGITRVRLVEDIITSTFAHPDLQVAAGTILQYTEVSAASGKGFAVDGYPPHEAFIPETTIIRDRCILELVEPLKSLLNDDDA